MFRLRIFPFLITRLFIYFMLYVYGIWMYFYNNQFLGVHWNITSYLNIEIFVQQIVAISATLTFFSHGWIYMCFHGIVDNKLFSSLQSLSNKGNVANLLLHHTYVHVSCSTCPDFISKTYHAICADVTHPHPFIFY